MASIWIARRFSRLISSCQSENSFVVRRFHNSLIIPLHFHHNGHSRRNIHQFLEQMPADFVTICIIRRQREKSKKNMSPCLLICLRACYSMRVAIVGKGKREGIQGRKTAKAQKCPLFYIKTPGWEVGGISKMVPLPMRKGESSHPSDRWIDVIKSVRGLLRSDR